MISTFIQKRGRLAGLAVPGLTVLLLFFLMPLAVILAESFANRGGAFLSLFEDRLFWRGLSGSAVLAVTSAGISLAAGFAVSMRLARLKSAARTFLMFFISLPLTFSGLIIAYGFILTFGRAGFVTLVLAKFGVVEPAYFAGFIYSPAGLAFAYCYYLIPRVIFILLPILVNFDQEQILAAKSLGAGRWQTLSDIVIPEILPSLIVSFCLVAAVAFGAYGTAYALVGTQVNILPLLLFSKISDVGTDFPAAAALSLILVCICASIMSVGEFFSTLRESKMRSIH